MKKITIVGGGIGGLATAALCAKEGYEVLLLEKNKIIGGRARFLRLGDFTFDMGPSWYMMPEVFENYFSLFNCKVEDFYKLKRLPVNYRVFFQEGEIINIYSELKKNLKTFKNLEKEGDRKLEKILNRAKAIYDLSLDKLVFQDYKNIFNLIKPSVLKLLLISSFFQSLDSYFKRRIKNNKLRKILEFTTVFLGGSPFNTPAFYQLVIHADFNLGIFYPLGGMYQIVEALKRLCKKYNVVIKTQEEVKGVRIKNQKIVSVLTNKSSYETDVLVVNADMPFFETKILPKKYQTYPLDYWEKKIPSPSAFIIYLGIKDKLPLSEHHNLYFTSNWEKHFDDVYKKRILPENPSFYWHVPSKTDCSFAPKHSHSVMILVPMPPGLFLSKKQLSDFCNKIIFKFAQLNKVKKLKEKIIVKRIYHSQDFVSDYNSYQGSAFGLAHTFFQSTIFRPRNYSKKLKNLFYVGHHTNPGIGVPPVLISSQIVFNLIKNELR